MKKVFQILVPDNTLSSRTISCENQVTELFVIDRADKKFVADYSTDLNKPALYILVNRDKRQLYVGETDDSLKRLRNHEAKDFWKEAIVFHSTTDTLSTTEVRWLEAKTYSVLKELGFYDLSENKQVPQEPSLKKNQIYTLEPIFEEAKNYICAAGFDIFLRKKEDNAETGKTEVEPIKQTEHIFYCRRAGSDAKGFLKDKDEKFVVQAGSILRSGECDALSAKSREKRNEFITKYCGEKDGQIILEKDFTFPSPSAAAVMMVGGSSNGWTRWKDAEGKTLDEVYRQTNHEATEEASTHETTSSSVKDKTGHTNKKDKTRYSIDGKTFTSMSACLREFITLYINQHKNITFYELKLVFNDALLERRHRVRGLLFKKDDYDAWTRPDKAQRYGANHENAILTAPDGIQFYVNTQWTQKSFRNIIKLAKKEGIKILASA